VHTLLPGLYWPIGQLVRATHAPLTSAYVSGLQLHEPVD